MWSGPQKHWRVATERQRGALCPACLYSSSRAMFNDIFRGATSLMCRAANRFPARGLGHQGCPAAHSSCCRGQPQALSPLHCWSLRQWPHHPIKLSNTAGTIVLAQRQIPTAGRLTVCGFAHALHTSFMLSSAATPARQQKQIMFCPSATLVLLVGCLPKTSATAETLPVAQVQLLAYSAAGDPLAVLSGAHFLQSLLLSAC